MRRAAAAAVAFLLTPAFASAAAAERGVIEGHVVNETTGERAPGVRVALVGGRADGSERIRRTATTDGRGRYRFTGLPTGGDRLYIVDATYSGGLFPGSPVSLPADTEAPPVIETRIKVWETTRDPRAVLIARDSLFLQAGDGGIDVIESVEVANMTDRAYVGRSDAPGAPTLSLPLPDAVRGGVQIVDAEIDVPELVRTETGAGLTVAIPPGQWRFTYAYRVPGIAGSHDLSRPALYPLVQASVHAPEGIEVASNRLTGNGEVTIGGTVYRRWSTTEALDEGSSLQISATVGGSPAGGAGALAAAIAVAVLLVAGTVWRTQRRRRRGEEAPAEPHRDHVLREIAALDIRRDAGEIDDEEWRARRRDLLGRLGDPEREVRV